MIGYLVVMLFALNAAAQTPDEITAYHVSNNRVDMTRPLCPYPQDARYKGVSSMNDAANFICKAP